MDEKLILFLSYVSCFLVSFIVSIIINKITIRIFRKKRVGQVERDYLKTHQVKAGTPTLGGISIIICGVLSYLIYSIFFGFSFKIIVIVIAFTGFALIGLIDDLLKVTKKNTAGLSGKIRLLLELSISLFALYYLGFNRAFITTYQLKIFDYQILIGMFIVPLIAFMLVGGSNAANLADGLDGLASGLLMISLFPFLIISVKLGFYQYSFFLLAVIGGILGFLVYNVHPAKIFMGDVGSLSLGALIVLSAVYLNMVILIPIAMVVFIIEALSVCIQVLYYKRTRKRVFLMTPLHHHYEKKNVPEYRIVIYFWLIGIIFSIIASFLGGI